MKRGGKKKEKKKREEKEIKNRAIFCSPFMSCSRTLPSVPLCSPHMNTERRSQAAILHSAQAHALLNKTRVKVCNQVPCSHPFPHLACPPLLYNLIGGRGFDAYRN